MTTVVQRAARLGLRDGRAAFLQHGPGTPAQSVAEAWLHDRRRHLAATVEQRLYVVAFTTAYLAAAAGRAAHTQKEQ